MICTVYSHSTGFEKITALLKQAHPKGNISLGTQDEFQIAEIEIKGGFFSSPSKLKIAYRQRNKLSYQLPEEDDSPLTTNLKGLYGYVSSLQTPNKKIQVLFLQKIHTLNCEFSIIQEQGQTKGIRDLVQTIAKEFDAVLFVQPDTVISKAPGQHFLDKDLSLILDWEGNSKIDDLKVVIDASYFDGDQSKITRDQYERKQKSESLLEESNIKLNRNLPYIEAEKDTTIRSAKEIAQRVSVLAVVNLVAFSTIPPDEAINYLQKYKLWEFTTPAEMEFLTNPTEDKKVKLTWKSECIWALLWALKKINNPGFPDTLCDLNNVPPADYPIGRDKDPNDFINSSTEIRSKSEILDASDLYYRLDWACVDARLNNQEITGVHPGVVYERHYALNWLINYCNQEWDDISCDT